MVSEGIVCLQCRVFCNGEPHREITPNGKNLRWGEHIIGRKKQQMICSNTDFLKDFYGESDAEVIEKLERGRVVR